MKPSKARRKIRRAQERLICALRRERAEAFDKAKARLDAEILTRGNKYPQEMTFHPNNLSKCQTSPT